MKLYYSHNGYILGSSNGITDGVSIKTKRKQLGYNSAWLGYTLFDGKLKLELSNKIYFDDDILYVVSDSLYTESCSVNLKTLEITKLDYCDLKDINLCRSTGFIILSNEFENNL
jgi:hypothetical protein